MSFDFQAKFQRQIQEDYAKYPYVLRVAVLPTKDTSSISFTGGPGPDVEPMDVNPNTLIALEAKFEPSYVRHRILVRVKKLQEGWPVATALHRALAIAAVATVLRQARREFDDFWFKNNV